jgi:hypothetical protein
MADKFLNTGGSAALNPSQPVKTNEFSIMVSSNLDITDVDNLQTTLQNITTGSEEVNNKTQNISTSTTANSTLLAGTLLPGPRSLLSNLGVETNRFLSVFLGNRVDVLQDSFDITCPFSTSNNHVNSAVNKRRFGLLNNALPTGNTLEVVDQTDLYGATPILTMKHTTGDVTINKGSLTCGSILPTSNNLMDIGSNTSMFRTASLSRSVIIENSSEVENCFLDTTNKIGPSTADRRRFKFCNNALPNLNTMTVGSCIDNGNAYTPIVTMEHTTGEVTINQGDLNCDTANINNIRLQSTGGTRSIFNHYEELILNVSWSGLWATNPTGVLKLTRIGNVVTCCVCTVTANANTAGNAISTVAIPTRFRPPFTYLNAAPVRDNASGNPQPLGVFDVRSDGLIRVWRAGSINDTIAFFSGLSNIGHTGWLNANMSWQV